MFYVRWKFLWKKLLINYQDFQERGHPSTGEASEMRYLKKLKLKILDLQETCLRDMETIL